MKTLKFASEIYRPWGGLSSLIVIGKLTWFSLSLFASRLFRGAVLFLIFFCKYCSYRQTCTYCFLRFLKMGLEFCFGNFYIHKNLQFWTILLWYKKCVTYWEEKIQGQPLGFDTKYLALKYASYMVWRWFGNPE